MALSNVQLKLSYRSGTDKLATDFLNPCLSESVLYRRAAGYFSSAGLALAARGLASMIERGGRMRLVCSPCLEPGDIEALNATNEDPSGILETISSRCLSDLEDALQTDRLNALAWLAASGRLAVRLAIRVNEVGEFERGIFHEKIGIFSDDQEEHVAFSGSSNETAGGLIDNFESFEVFCSWRDAERRVESKIGDFEALWENRTNGLRVIEFSEAGRDLLDRFRDRSNPPPGIDLIANDVGSEPRERAGFRIPAHIELREYQKEAIRAWGQNGGRGILAMATGTGKTLTALCLAAKVAEKNRPMVLIVICPFLNLCRQWMREMAAFGLYPLACFEGKDKWQSRFEEGYQRLSHDLATVHAIVTTNKTFQSSVFQSCLQPHVTGTTRQHHLIIADEVHNLGAKAVSEKLPAGISLRLGLSATPERHLDPEGTAAVLDYFGDIIYEFGIQRAIAEGHLCRYRYHPIVVHLTEEESEQYSKISKKLGPLLASAESNLEVGQTALSLLLKRARLLAGAENKIGALHQLLNNLPEKPRKAIFYCGDGVTTDKVRDEEVRQIQAVARLLGNEHDLRVRSFTYRESPTEREEILRDLGSGYLDGVVAIRCLDEGIDLPDLQMGFLLASSTNPRQFVQRRGRLLRKAHGKRMAEIYDFIIAPPDLGEDIDDSTFNLERSMFQRELKRIEEFCETADNGPEAMNSFVEMRNHFSSLVFR